MAGVNPQQVVDLAMSLQGTPYVWGGNTPGADGGFDCSGFVYYVYGQLGISLPRGSIAQAISGTQIGSLAQAQPGDLIGFNSDNDGTAEHIGIYLGNGDIVVADEPGTVVRVNTLNNESSITSISRPTGVFNLDPSQAAAITTQALGPQTNVADEGGDMLGAGQNGGGSFGGTGSTSEAGAPYNGSTITSSQTTAMGGSTTAAIPASQPTFNWWAGMGITSPTLSSNAETYGLIDAFIGNNPDLQNLYSQAVAGSWSQDQFTAALEATNWWKQNSSSMRQVMAQQATDPAAWQQSVTTEQASIAQMAVQMGVSVSTNGLNNLAQTALIMQQTPAQIQSTLASYLNMSQQGWYGGYAGQVELGLKLYAADQGIPMSQTAVNNAVQGIVAGTGSLSTQRAYIQTQAASAFPAYADLINQGVTVGQIAAPYLNTVAGILEQNPNSVDLYNPLLRNALQYVDPTTKQPAVLPVYNYETQLRKMPQWQQTNNARESLMGTANQVLSDMGLQTSDVGSAPTTGPASLTSINSTVAASNTGLSGQTSFPTLEMQQALQTPAAPTLLSGTSSNDVTTPTSGTATDLAPSGPSTQGTPQGVT